MIKPFIHLIDTPYGYYFFDVNTHTINKITSRKNKMKNYKHSQKWYEMTHDILAATLLIGGIFFLVFICSLLECV